MGRGGCGGKVNDEDEDDYDPSDSGPIKDRSCTDVVCLLLFVVFLVGWGVISAYAFVNGNPAQLIYPSDSNGEICGTADFAEKPFLLFFDLTRCIKLSAALSGCATPQVCVDKCPTEYWSYATGSKDSIKHYCTRLSPGEFEGTDIKDLVRARKCPAYVLPSTPVLGRCVPTFGLTRSSPARAAEVTRIVSLKRDDDTPIEQTDLTEGIEYLMKLIDIRGIGSKLLSDLAVYWWVILVSLILAFILSFVWIVLLRYAAAPMIWLSILVCVLLLCASTGFSWFRYTQLVKAGEQADKDEIFLPPFASTLSSYYYNKDLWLGIAIVMSIITAVILLILLFLRSRISIAIELIEEASKAVGSNMTVVFFPIGPYLAQGLVILWFCLVASYLASSGEPEYKVVDTCKDMTCTNPETKELFQKNEVCNQDTFSCPSCPEAKCVFHKFGPSDLELMFQFYNLFALFWILFFVSALGEMVMAGAFAGWYWTMDKEHDLPSSPIISSLYRTLRYHLGTLAFGSLVLSIVRMIRVMIEYVEDKLKQYEQNNPVVKAVLCMCKCCFYCLESWLKYLNRNAYIITAVYGNSFCGAARRAFNLLFRNIARVVVLDKVTDFILFIGKLVVVALVMLASMAMLRSITPTLDQELNYQIVPMFVVVLSTYAIASCFFSVYNMAVDTIFLSFLEDIDKHDGTPEKPYYMNDDLKAILGKMNTVKEDGGSSEGKNEGEDKD